MELKGSLIRLAGAGAALALGSTLMVGAATSAQAAVTNYQVINGNSSNACLQVTAKTGEQGIVILGTCDRSAKQVWQIQGGVFRNPATNECLDGNGAEVYTLPCDSTDAYQRWTTTSGSPKSISHDVSGHYLNGSGVVGSQVNFQPTIGTASRWVIDQV